MEEKEFYYYLAHLPECRANVQRGLILIRRLSENDTEIIASNVLHSRFLTNAVCDHFSDSDSVQVKLMEKCDREKREIAREQLRLLRRVQKEKGIVLLIEGEIGQLPEPKREVITNRYLDKLTWNEIQKRTGRSPANLFKIHKDAIRILENALCHNV